MGVGLVLGIAGAALAATISAAVAMGAVGGGGGYGSTGGASGMGSSKPSEYAVAVRLIKHQKCNEALPHLTNALADNPKSANTLNYLGYCQRIIGNYQYSLVYYNQALAIDPEHRGVHEYLGELYLQMNQPDKANAELATLASLCPRGCDEQDALTKAIASYQPPAATAAAPASAPVAGTPAAAPATGAATPSQ